MGEPVGPRGWAIAAGNIPGWSDGPGPQVTGHETTCLLNAGGEEAHVEITVLFEDQKPAGLHRITVPPRSTLHARFDELEEPEKIPSDADYAGVIESDAPIVVQHTRLDSRQAENALMSAIAYASNECPRGGGRLPTLRPPPSP